MILPKTIQTLRKKDFIFLLACALLFLMLSLSIKSLNFYAGYYVNLGIFYLLATLVLLVVRKTGAIIIFCLITAFITTRYSFFNFLNYYQSLIVFLVIGIVFELVFCISKLKIKNIPLDVLLGTTLSSATIPWTVFYFTTERTLSVNSFNLSIISFFTTIIASSIAFLIWFKIKSSKQVLKFVYE